MIYTDKGAAMMKAHAGKSWRPSNGHEGDLFMAMVCARCVVDMQECQINIAAMVFSKGDPEYPAEWQIGQDGQPCCTAFAAAHREPLSSAPDTFTRGGDNG